MTMLAERSGFVRVVARADNHLVLGIQAVGAGRVGTVAGVRASRIEMGARLEDIAGTIHAHPTQGEAFHEAALKALGHAAAHLSGRDLVSVSLRLRAGAR